MRHNRTALLSIERFAKFPRASQSFEIINETELTIAKKRDSRKTVEAIRYLPRIKNFQQTDGYNNNTKLM